MMNGKTNLRGVTFDFKMEADMDALVADVVALQNKP
jgi:hypothetical protein